ncbi:hypothetical protein SFC07_11135 [Corynebacterium callunae]|uniref:hypothetical protein n=1 Tax=Corynebacterium callunae TaxID=1721 RepID=UPI003982BD19
MSSNDHRIEDAVEECVQKIAEVWKSQGWDFGEPHDYLREEFFLAIKIYGPQNPDNNSLDEQPDTQPYLRGSRR